MGRGRRGGGCGAAGAAADYLGVVRLQSCLEEERTRTGVSRSRAEEEKHTSVYVFSQNLPFTVGIIPSSSIRSLVSPLLGILLLASAQ